MQKEIGSEAGGRWGWMIVMSARSKREEGMYGHNKGMQAKRCWSQRMGYG